MIPRDIKVIRLSTRHPDPADLATMRGWIADRRDVWIACDGYHFDNAYVAALRSDGTRVIQVVDGMGSDRFEPDVLLNQNAGAEEIDYRCAPWTRTLLGTRYALIRPEFVQERAATRAPSTQLRAFVLMGGADTACATEKVIAALGLVDLPQIVATIVVGSQNARALEIELAAVAEKRHLLLVRRDPLDLAGLMHASDVAISAAGSTCWELCCLGVPSILLTAAPNQVPIAAAVHAEGAGVSLGWHADVQPPDIAREVTRLLRDRQLRARMARAGRCLVDGQGAARVAAILAAGTR